MSDTVESVHLSDQLGVETRIFNGIKFYSLTDEHIETLHKKAKDKAWNSRRLDLCRCDMYEYCEHCFPPSFQKGGKWDI